MVMMVLMLLVVMVMMVLMLLVVMVMMVLVLLVIMMMMVPVLLVVMVMMMMVLYLSVQELLLEGSRVLHGLKNLFPIQLCNRRGDHGGIGIDGMNQL